MDAPWQVHRRGMPAYENVMSQTERRGECLIFTGFIANNGYGRIETKATGVVHAHRVVAEHHYGASNLHVLHSCDTPTCVEPSHLRYGTTEENTADRTSRERDARGRKNGNAVLTEAKVRAIRADPRPSEVVAQDYGCGSRTVRKIRARETWAWLD